MPQTPALLLMASLLLATPLAGQMGLASAPRSVTLSATRPASVSLALLDGESAGLTPALEAVPRDLASVTVRTRWSVDPAEPVVVTLVAVSDGLDAASDGTLAGVPPDQPTVRAPTGGPKTYVPFRLDAFARESSGRARPLFTQPISAPNARGGRTDDVQVGVAGTLSLVAITQ